MKTAIVITVSVYNSSRGIPVDTTRVVAADHDITPGAIPGPRAARGSTGLGPNCVGTLDPHIPARVVRAVPTRP